MKLWSEKEEHIKKGKLSNDRTNSCGVHELHTCFLNKLRINGIYRLHNWISSRSLVPHVCVHVYFRFHFVCLLCQGMQTAFFCSISIWRQIIDFMKHQGPFQRRKTGFGVPSIQALVQVARPDVHLNRRNMKVHLFDLRCCGHTMNRLLVRWRRSIAGVTQLNLPIWEALNLRGIREKKPGFRFYGHIVPMLDNESARFAFV